MAILVNGKKVAGIGQPGKSAYQTAVEGGYTGSESEFNQILASAATESYVDSKMLSFTNQTVTTTLFLSNSTYPDYPYRAAVILSGVTENYIPYVTFNVTDATSGNFAPVAESDEGHVYIYSKEVPAADITIPVIQCIYGGS